MRLLIVTEGGIIIFIAVEHVFIERGGRMDINNELIEQWEPKINKMLQNTFVIGMDKTDIAQELRIAIVKAAQGFNEDKGILFHTYLHTAMVNTIRTLIYKAGRQLKSASLDAKYNDSDYFAYEDLLADEDNTLMEDVEFDILLSSMKFNSIEQNFLRLRIEGLTMEEITQDLGDSAYKIRHSLQEKVKFLI
jgi:RNA polymerase sigma factor (sigma-70 family)